MIKILYLALALVAPIGLVACGSSGSTPAANGPIDASGIITGEKARKAVGTISASVVALGTVAIEYASLPTCPQAAGVFCKDAGVAREIAVAFGAADDALKNAEAYLKQQPSGDAGDAIRLANVGLATLQSIVLKYNLTK